MAHPLDLTPGAARRGGGRAVWPETPPIVVDCDSLRPGLDMVRVRAEASPVPAAPGTWCLYLGRFEGAAVVLPEGAASPVPLPPWSLDEPEALPCDTVDPQDFLDGWAAGRFAEAHERPVSTRLRGGPPPTAWDRGFACGFRDVREGRACRPGSWEPYNRTVRALAERYPDEHAAPELRRRRTLMAVAA